MTNNIILQSISVTDLENMLQALIRSELETMKTELQRIIGEDDLVSTGTACRILGVSSKTLKVMADQGYFTVYHHLKDRRYNRAELLDYRNQFRSQRKRG